MAVVKYQIRRMDLEDTPALQEEGAELIFTDPAEAAAYSKRWSKILGEKLCVKTISDPKWRVRETNRYNTGEYLYLPWAAQRWWLSDGTHAIWKDQFPHPSVEKPGWIAYTKSAEDGTKDKQTVLRPGSYLTQYFERSIDIHGVSRGALVDMFMALYGPIEVKFAETESDIIAAYENGPHTCMVGKRWPKDGRNPAYIYAAGDLQVAYLGDLKNGVSARTLVWPMKKIYSRVYGDIAKITKGLERLGYKWGAPIGAKVLRRSYRKIEFDPKAPPPSGCFISPYIDKKNQQGGGHLAVVDKGDHLIIVEDGTLGSHHCGLPDGLSGNYVPRADEHPTFACEKCDTQGHTAVYTIYVDDEGTEEKSWCGRCATRHSFVCGYSGGRFSGLSVEKVVVGNTWWNERYADLYSATCDMTGERWPERSVIRLVIDGEETNVGPNWLTAKGGYFTSQFTNRNYLKSEMVGVSSRLRGRVFYAGKHELKHHAFQCDGCDGYSMLDERTQHDDRLFCLNCTDKMKGDKPPVSASRKAFDAERRQLNA